MRRIVAAAIVLASAGCGEQSESSLPPPPTAPEPTASTEPEPPPAATEEQTKALPGLPGYTAGYELWIRLDDKPIPPRPAGDAHLGTKKVYSSRPPRANGDFPDRTIIVKEAIRPGKDFLGLIAIMRKEEGADPAHNDWRFVEFTRGGRRDHFAETASGTICWTCHMGAAKTDYVWIYTLGLAR
jgi:hypothetical protein